MDLKNKTAAEQQAQKSDLDPNVKKKEATQPRRVFGLAHILSSKSKYLFHWKEQLTVQKNASLVIPVDLSLISSDILFGLFPL